MKHLLSFFALLLAVNFGLSQQITLNDEFSSSKILDVHFLSEDSYIQAMIIEDYDEKGLLQWIENNKVTRQVFIENIVQNMRFREESNGLNVDVQIHSDCDVPMYIFENILIDTISVEKIRFGYEDIVDIEYRDAYNFGDSVSYYLTQEDKIIKTDINVEEDLVFETDFTNYSLDFKFGKEKVFIFGGDSLLYINLYTGANGIIGTEGNFIYDIAEMGSDLYVLGTLSLDVFDETAAKVKSIAFPDENLFAYELLIDEDRVFIIGSQRDNEYHKTVYELVGEEFIELYTESYETLNPGNMYWNPYSGLVLVGDLTYDTYPVFYGSHAIMIDLEKEEVLAPDLGIELENIVAVQHETGAYQLEVSVMVSNYGQDTAKNVHIYSSAFGGVWCSTKRFEHLENEILPGESSLITKIISPFYTSNSIDREICFWVNGSDRLFDPEYDNHFTCSQVVGTEEISKAQPLSISPNPVQDVLNINGGFMGDTYTIITMHGQNIARGKLVNEINTESLLPGIYFLQVSNENRMETLKFIKAE